MPFPLLSGRLAFVLGRATLGSLLLTLSASASLSVQTNPAGPISLNLGYPAALSASVQVTAPTGVAPFTYQWTRTIGTNSWISDAASDNPTITAIVNWGDNFTESWTVTVTDAGGTSGSASVSLNFSAPSADGVPDAVNRVPIRGSVAYYTLTTALRVGQTTYPIQVYVPADYSATSDPLPVIYATDAGPLNNGAISVPWEFSDAVRFIEAQHLRFIVVGIGGDETRNYDFLLPGADPFYTFITTEMIPFVESRYDVDPSARTLSGHSFGGMFAGYVFLRERPGTRFFSNYIALDGSFWVNPVENGIMEQALYGDTNGSLPGISLVLTSSTGGNDGSVSQFYQELVALHFRELQLTRVPNFNTSHLQMYDEAFAASLQTIVLNIPGSFTAPVITVQPASTSVAAGSTLSLQVTAVGGGLNYQWSKDGAPIVSATGWSYSVFNPTSADAGSYTVVVKNHVGSVTSSAATVTINAQTPGSPPATGGGGGGGGGTLGPVFFSALALLPCARRLGLRRHFNSKGGREA